MNSIDIYNAHLKMKNSSRDFNGNVSYKRNGGNCSIRQIGSISEFYMQSFLEHSRDEVLAIRLKFPNKLPVSR